MIAIRRFRRSGWPEFRKKRLEKGTFAKLWRDDGQVVRLTASELALFIEGCTLVGKQMLSPTAVERKSLVSDRAM